MRLIVRLRAPRIQNYRDGHSNPALPNRDGGQEYSGTKLLAGSGESGPPRPRSALS